MVEERLVDRLHDPPDLAEEQRTGARARKRRETGRCEGRKPAPEAAQKAGPPAASQGPEPAPGHRQAGEKGCLGPAGKPYGAQSIQVMLRQ
jgi:hypothetical protein